MTNKFLAAANDHANARNNARNNAMDRMYERPNPEQTPAAILEATQQDNADLQAAMEAAEAEIRTLRLALRAATGQRA